MKNIENNKNMWKNFSEQRTDFFVSAGFLLIESIIPGILVWLLVGNDFSFSFLNNLPDPKVGYIILICIIYLMFTFLSTFIFYILKLHKEDNFTYATTTTLVFITLILLGFAFNKNDTVFIIIKLVIVLFSAIIAVTLGVFITYIAKNKSFKKLEIFENYLSDYKEGKSVPLKIIDKIKKYEINLEQQKQKQKKIDDLKIELENKIEAEYQQQKQKDLEKKQKLNEKLDSKEKKARLKEQKKEAKKNKIEFK
ncbi:hypothetical protein SGLAD_v1c04230 [Spiroplasma gladiatoris]|uniref:Uncharacterized protein n=1 Tax=Spiroplasma gladiatoris TaxID=2143 RepID=A0A4P7AHG3_9MOLU|nr:hypothetical protein [Spiroplasma gladiatoris]QBQ07622.1 hypothetical protein SGLAD_v1c04230 [Spiroplasma gladiatoris]